MLRLNKKIKLYGLPRSGTNFLEFLLIKNYHASIAIVKNPFSWLRSIHEFTLGREHIFKRYLPFSDFLREEYIWDSDLYGKGTDRVYIHHENPIVYWNTMNKHWMQNATVWVQYETVLSGDLDKINFRKKRESILWPDQIIKPGKGRFAEDLSGDENNSYEKKEYYLNKSYMNYYTKEDVDFVNNCVDCELTKFLQ